MMTDTGVSVNIVSRSFLAYLGLAMHPTTAITRDINGELVGPVGEAELTLQVDSVERGGRTKRGVSVQGCLDLAQAESCARTLAEESHKAGFARVVATCPF